jgi:Membrane protease subunits, stomatin/prohibitin homologs
MKIATRTEALIQATLDEYGTGLNVTTVNLESAQPPEAVQAAFSDAIKAREDEQRFINESEAYANRNYSLKPEVKREAILEEDKRLSCTLFS